MHIENLLRVMGEALDRGLRSTGVPISLADAWRQEWALMTADAVDESSGPCEIATRLIRLMTTAQDLVHVHGR